MLLIKATFDMKGRPEKISRWNQISIKYTDEAERENELVRYDGKNIIFCKVGELKRKSCFQMLNFDFLFFSEVIIHKITG